ncbi:hypothetical protein PoB_003269700 [Plakobranchus ocellatus]|uniref:Uncharacterized protein n=1 Tax=Plakobranchus ocellatus TaxID=259542 RepID=A0AAV4AH11_9GAST|nr:hypothetical protein PoB_003269700 [Plakobranchus ocellatus]
MATTIHQRVTPREQLVILSQPAAVGRCCDQCPESGQSFLVTLWWVPRPDSPLADVESEFILHPHSGNSGIDGPDTGYRILSGFVDSLWGAMWIFVLTLAETHKKDKR